MRFTAVFSLVLAVFSSALLAQDKDYEIRLDRPLKPGDQLKISATAKSSQQIEVTSGEKTLQSNKDEFSAEYAATRKVLEVDAKGRATKISDTIDQLTMTKGGDRKELAQKGATLVATTEGRKHTYELDGKRVDAETSKVLDAVVDLSKSGASDDEIFGTKERKKPGDTWDIDAARVAEDMKDSDMKLENLTGKVTLVKVTQEAGGDVLHINAHVTGEAHPALPPTVTLVRGPLELTFSGKFPADLSLGRPEDSGEMKLEFEAHGQARNGDPVTLKGAIQRSSVNKQTPLK